ncbi:MAG: rhodanese-like domain-containing protein [Verrucomicrobiota bacterium]|nr:rhodanese-like domain-containing protein [Verrucomicrobiota bacterium]
MKTNSILTGIAIAVILNTITVVQAADNQRITNPHIDYSGFLKDAGKVQKLREDRRVSELDFIKMSQEAGVIVLDCRSADKYKMLHITGAINLPLTDITEAELAKVIPSKSTKVLIYCNNNFGGEPLAFACKGPMASLNIYSFNTLFSYGYTNVYELGPFIDTSKSKINFSRDLEVKKPI